MSVTGHNDRPPGRAELALRTAVVVAVVAGAALIGLLVWDLRRILVWVLIAVVLAVTVAPAVSFLERHRVPRWLGACLITFVTAAVVAAIVTAVAVPVATQSDQLLNGLPRLAHDLLGPGGPLGALNERLHLERRVGEITPARVLRFVAGPRTVSSMFSQAAALGAAVLTVVTLTIMLLLEGPRGWRLLMASLGERASRIDAVGRRMQRSVSGYMAGNLLISVLATIGSFVAMSIIGVPYALPLALAVGLLDIIPLVGATLGAVLCVLVALVVGWPQALALVSYFVIYQQCENHLLAPVIYARTVVMSPLAVLLVSLAGAMLGGVVGVLLAIPLAGAGQIAVRELLEAKGIGRRAEPGDADTEGSPGDEGPGRAPDEQGASQARPDRLGATTPAVQTRLDRETTRGERP